MQSPLIGTGFYAKASEHHEKLVEFRAWLRNTGFECPLVIVDNSDLWMGEHHPARIVRVNGNLGHMSAPARYAGRFTGWSISWMIPALIAYSEGRDFIYKEQDCFAFGSWREVIQCGDFTVGRNSRMPCEQSLFFIRHRAIIEVIRAYTTISESDQFMSTEDKFMRCGATFHALGCGRDRPLTPNASAWYAQKLTPEEINELV